MAITMLVEMKKPGLQMIMLVARRKLEVKMATAAAIISTITMATITMATMGMTTMTGMKMPVMLKKEEGPKQKQEEERGDLQRPSSRPASSAISATPMEYGFGYRTIATW